MRSEKNKDTIYQLFKEQYPELDKKILTYKLVQARKVALSEFKASLSDSSKKERDYWQPFLEKNRWMFGLSYFVLLDESRIDLWDTAFLRQYLTEDLMLELGLYRHEKKGDDRIITHISDKDNWKIVKESLLKNLGLAAAPVIKILDSDFKGQQVLYLLYEYDGRELDISYEQQTMIHLRALWQRKVVLQSRLADKAVFLTFDGTGSVKISNNLF